MLGKTVAIAAAAMMAVASAQLASLPQCALNPALAVVAGQTKCGLTEFSCICADQGLLSSLTSTVEKACTNSADLSTAQAAAASICVPYATTSAADNVDAATTTDDSSDSTNSMSGAAASTDSASATGSAYYPAGNSTTGGSSSGAASSTAAAGSSIATGGANKGAAAAGSQREGVTAVMMAVLGAFALF